MKVEVKGKTNNFEIDNDRSRIDFEAIWHWLHNVATWSKSRTRDQFERQVENTWMCFGVYEMDGSREGKGKNIGFARVISDSVSHAYLSDVFVYDEYRGNGLGKALLTHIFNDEGRDKFQWTLHTDNPKLYHPFGLDEKQDKYIPMKRWPGVNY